MALKRLGEMIRTYSQILTFLNKPIYKVCNRLEDFLDIITPDGLAVLSGFIFAMALEIIFSVM